MPDYTHLLIIGQESGQIVNVDRSGKVYSKLTIVADPGSPLDVADMTMEGVTMDGDGTLYVVNENGGGDADHPQLWVYQPSTATNLAPARGHAQKRHHFAPAKHEHGVSGEDGAAAVPSASTGSR